MIETRRKRRTRVRRENASYWMSYSDVMAALLLMLVLLLFFYVNKYLSLQTKREMELASKESQLRQQEELLTQTEALLAQKADELANANSQLNSQQLELDDKNLKLEESLSLLAQQQLDYETQKALLALAIQEADATRQELETKEVQLAETAQRLTDQDKELILQRLDVDRLRQMLESQTQELGRQQAMIDEMVGVRAAIIAKLRDSLAAANINVKVDEKTGAITLDSAVFFDYGSATIKSSGKTLLNAFIPVYVRTLLSGDNSEYVSELIVEGHTDSKGSYDYNLNLSQQRAYNVVSYCLSDQFYGLSSEEKNVLRERVTANGRAFSEPIYNADGSENSDASRRVEFKFRLKDDEMINSMSAILNAVSAATPIPETLSTPAPDEELDGY
ncbi:MAG: OmpA family protein [Oscillospiraceae bacterium]|jgi:chemotaxis protein MotB|nr:OmpA family protein [Oscillospiraceae bacterium]